MLLLAGILLHSCKGQVDSSSEDSGQPAHIGLFSPIQLNDDSTEIFLEDFFPNGEWPDSIKMHSQLAFQEDRSNKRILVGNMDDGTPWLSTLDLWFGTQEYNILVKRSRMVPFELIYESKGDAPQKVEVAGDVNGWTPSNSPMEFKDGKWHKTFLLNPGRYQYQLIVDGNWMLDPANPTKVENGMGGFNSEMNVGEGMGREVAEPTLNWQWNNERDEIELLWDEIPWSSKLNFMWIPPKHQVPENVFAFWENQRIEVIDRGERNLSFRIPDTAATVTLSHLRIFAMTDDFWTNDLFIPLVNGRIAQDPKALKAADAQSNVIYFMMVDRFMNGKLENDAPLQDSGVHYKANFHGGDLVGITQKIKEGYFDTLGVNMLWLSPIIRNPEGPYREYPAPRRLFSGYHGYWPISSTRVDHRFGTEAELKELVKEAHGHGMKVILDFVANHVHEEHPILKEHPEWKTPLYLEDSSLNVRKWDAQRLTTWFDTFMPSLDFSNPAVVEFQSDSALYWIKEFDLDGFRHDATKHIPTPFWRRLTQKLKTDYMLKENKELYQIGETFGSRELIGSYVGSGLLDGQFDFNYYWTLRGIFSGSEKRLDRLTDAMKATETAYGSHSKMGNITGNHDMPRFISYAGKAINSNEDPKEAGWNRDVQIKDKAGYKRLQMLQAWLLVGPGIPVIYFGDEIGMVGAGDPDNRRDMKFEGLTEDEQATKNVVAKLTHLRNNSMALQYGNTEVFVENKVLAMRRNYGQQTVLLLINLGESEVDFELNQLGAAEWNSPNRPSPVLNSGPKFNPVTKSIQLPSMSFEVWNWKAPSN